MKLPAVKYFAILSTGILTGYFLDIGLIASLIICSISLAFLLLSLKINTIQKFYPLFVFMTGLILIQGINEGRIDYTKKITPDFTGYFKGKVTSVISQTGTKSKYMLAGYLDPSISEPFESKLYLTVFERNYKKRLRLGDYIQSDLTLHSPQTLTLPTDFDEVAYARSQDFYFYAKTNSSKISLLRKAEGFDKLISSIRNDVANRLKVLFSNDSYPIILALITGDKSNIDYAVKEDFSITGTAHILAVSGLHVGIISAILFVILGWIRNRIIKFSIFNLLLYAYIILSGIQPSAMRAGLMATLIYIAYLSQRHVNLLNIVSMAVIILIVVEPALIFSIGFQMSVGALLGISIFLTPILRFFDKIFPSQNSIIRFIKSSLAMTFSVTIVVSPIIAMYFKTYSIISPIANLLIVPLSSVVMIYGILALSLSYIFIPLATIFSTMSDLAIILMKAINSFLGGFSLSKVEFSVPLLMSVIISLALVYIFYSNSKRLFLFRTLLASLVVTLSFFISEIKSDDNLNIFPRHDFVLLRVKTDKINYNFLLDRKPHIRTKIDYSAYRYLSRQTGKEVCFISGNAGMYVSDALRKDKKIELHELPLSNIRRFLSILNLDYHVVQYIDI